MSYPYRFQEIAGNFEAALESPFTPSNGKAIVIFLHKYMIKVQDIN